MIAGFKCRRVVVDWEFLRATVWSKFSPDGNPAEDSAGKMIWERVEEGLRDEQKRGDNWFLSINYLQIIHAGTYELQEIKEDWYGKAMGS